MQCPYCQQVLIKGHIQTRGEVIKWLPAEKEVSFLESRGNIKDGEIALGHYHFLTGDDVEAYRCQNCHKIIIDYK
ncbi:MAG: PF20097 family protein [Beduini sp.]|uniref:PF20097 family protein n=1 Tax=Beduini sp. TaxID=1922300 RepID=UPI0011C99B4F